MQHWKEGDRAKVVSRAVTDEDRKANRYFEHMGRLVGTIANVYSNGEVALNVDIPSVGKVTKTVHDRATERMRSKFNDNATEEQRKALTKEEMEFTPNYVILLSPKDVEAV